MDDRSSRKTTPCTTGTRFGLQDARRSAPTPPSQPLSFPHPTVLLSARLIVCGFLRTQRRNGYFYFYFLPKLPLTPRHPTSTALVAQEHVARHDTASNGDHWPATRARSACPATSTTRLLTIARAHWCAAGVHTTRGKTCLSPRSCGGMGIVGRCENIYFILKYSMKDEDVHETLRRSFDDLLVLR